MTEPISLLNMQIQQKMFEAMLQASKLSSGSASSGNSDALSFENLLSGILGNSGSDDSTAIIPDDSLLQFSALGNTYSATMGGLSQTGNRQVSSSLVNFVAAHEGYSGTAYRGADVQNQTIGYGHVIEPGEQIGNLSQAQALGLLEQNLTGPAASVSREFAGTNLSQNQFDALVSFAYNLGDNIWSRAPKLVNDIKTGASADVLKADFTQFDHCNGQELKGLYNRRVDEWSLFTTGNYN